MTPLWLDEPLYAQETALPRLREMLTKAEKGYVGACGYGAKLTLTFLGSEENTEFWTMFGLDPATKEPFSLHEQ